MNSLGAVMILAVVLFIGLALAFRLAIRRAEKTDVGSAEAFVTGAAIAGTSMYALQRPESQPGSQDDGDKLPPLPLRPAK